MQTNETWKTQRAACRQMFFKSKLATMVSVTKNHLNIACDKWMAEIEAKGETRIDITVEFMRIFAHTINNIAFGTDLNDERFNFLFYDKPTNTFVDRKCSFREAVSTLVKQCFLIMFARMMHPISGPVQVLFGI